MARTYVRKKPLKTLGERLLEKIDFRGPGGCGCWLWTGAPGTCGSGQVRWGPRGSKRASPSLAMYEVFVGVVPAGHSVFRRCRRLLCVNPKHLFTGTAKDRPHTVKTHCPQGHPYSGKNLYVNPTTRGKRCRKCLAAAKKRWLAKPGVRARQNAKWREWRLRRKAGVVE